MAPPTATSTRAATIAHPAPAGHMTPNAARRQREEHHYRVLLITAENFIADDFLAWHALQDQLATTYSSDEPTDVSLACSR